MRRFLAVSCLTLAVPASAWSHVVSPSEVEARVLEAEASRARNTSALNDALSSPDVARLAREAGVDVEVLRRAHPTLTDEELQDLATRGRALAVDPAAGAGKTTYLIVGAAVVLVAIIAIAASSGGSGY